MPQSSMLHIRVEDDIKIQANEALAAIGLSMSDAVRILLKRVVNDQAFPLELNVPNPATRVVTKDSPAKMKAQKARLDTAVDLSNVLKASGASIGDRLKLLLEIRGIKQTELAKSIGITQSAISNVVRQSSRKPSAPTLLRMADALNCSANWLITGEGHPFEVSTIDNRAEKELLDAFRSMDDQAQHAILAVAKVMSRKQSKTVKQ